MELIFNELSLAHPAPDRFTARAWMKSLQQTVHAAASHGLPAALRTRRDFFALALAPDYSIGDWSVDPAVDREVLRYLKRVADRAPYLEDLFRQVEDARGVAAEFRCDGSVGHGVGLAAMIESPVVSLPAAGCQRDALPVAGLYVNDAGDVEQRHEVRNLYEPPSAARHGAWFAERTRGAIASGRDLLARRAAVLERLDFADHARAQLERLTGRERPFRFVLEHLFALNEHARAWSAGPFAEGYRYRCSDESAQTLALFTKQRTFRCPDGRERVFSWHSKVNIEAWRIHFIPDDATRRVLVGYVGPHLPTESDPH